MDDQKDIKKRRIPKKINLQIGERCRHAREAAGYTQERLAEQIGVSTQFLSDAERGITGMSVSTIIKLCNVLSVSADFLLRGQEPKAQKPSAVSEEFSELSPQEIELVEEGFALLKKAFLLRNTDPKKDV